MVSRTIAEGELRRKPTRNPPQRQLNDNCPLRHRRANPYIVHMRRSYESLRRSREGIIPSPSGRGQGEGSGDGESNQMQPNATELKVPSPLATPDEIKLGHNEATLVHPVRVSGVPNEARVASFSASTVGVNQAELGQMRPLIENFASRPHRPAYERNDRK